MSNSSKHTRNIRRKLNADNDWAPEETPEVVDSGETLEIEETTLEREERERDADIEERDAFAERLRDRDKERTKRLIEDRSSKADTESRKRRNLANDPEARRAAVEELRGRSRQQYLKLREEQKVLELQQKIQDEEYLFQGESLTDAERKALEYDKEVLRIVRERQNIDDKPEGYVIPEGELNEHGKLNKHANESLLTKRYEEKEEQFVREQDQWEEHQIHKAKFTTGPRDREALEGGDYDYVFDEQPIDFILANTVNKPSQQEAAAMAQITAAERKALSIAEVRRSLPVYQFRTELLEAIEEFQILIIVGETGSGKTTQLPQYLHEAGYTKDNKKVGCTQPRRVAAMSVAARVAEEMGVKLGYEVGYSIRFEDCTSDKTVLKYMTDGTLLREFLTEPDLASYSALIIDEAHERTLHTDVLFGLVKDIARFRPDLKLLISSATMDAQKFSEYFDDAPIFKIPGRPYPVDIYYTPAPEANYLTAAITTILQIHTTQDKGDILVFLTGQEEIEAAQESLQQTCRVLGSKIAELIICPIYASLPSEMQGKIFEPTPEGARKVVLATNIAETSITIDGVVFVIDPGFVKQNGFNPKTGMESLMVVPCSKAAANQRSGRAGRVGPGKCFRLFTQWAFENEMDDNTTPEIQRTNLSSVILMLKSLGIHDLINFDFMDPPPAETVINSLSQLYALGATTYGGIPHGPMLAKMIVASEQYHCSEEIASICGMLSVQNSIFYRPKDKRLFADQARRDHITLLNIWEQWVETEYSMQWCYENFIQYRSMSRRVISSEIPLASNPDASDVTPIKRRSGERYKTLKQNQDVYIHPSSALFEVNPKWVIYYELVLTSKEYIRQVMDIKAEWLVECKQFILLLFITCN
ncbi:P-loop containing nucleoside triphosphate hydrolase protein [Syncephalis plumigaleata]|nr:P-loop containing nucleoside triphosphate hydrolase protein [Syncephalis plumigaleata]